jgi:hypothetical protein
MLLGEVESELGGQSIGSMLLLHATAAKAWQRAPRSLAQGTPKYGIPYIN